MVLENLRNRASDFFSTGDKGRETILASSGRETTKTESESSEAKTPKERLKRKSFGELEKYYSLDPSLFNGINLIANQITGAGYSLTGEDKDKIESWIQEVGFDRKLEKIVRQSLIFGNAFGEIVYNQDGSKIMDLAVIDPVSMEFLKEGTKIRTDDEGSPYYVQKVGIGEDVEFTPEEMPEDHFPKIKHFRLYEFAKNRMGFGLVEPLMKSLQVKLNLEEAVGEVSYRLGSPIVKAQVGDEDHHPSENQLEGVKDAISDLTSKSQLVTRDYVDVELMEPSGLGSLTEVLQYYKIQTAAGLGVPSLFLYGTGEDVNRATSRSLERQFYQNVLTYQSIFQSQIQEFINLWCDKRDLERVKFSFNDPRVERLDEFARRMNTYVKSGILSPNEAMQKYIVDREDFPEEIISKTESKSPEEEAEEESDEELTKEFPEDIYSEETISTYDDMTQDIVDFYEELENESEDLISEVK